jgi:hypothetical protein
MSQGIVSVRVDEFEKDGENGFVRYAQINVNQGRRLKSLSPAEDMPF